jgi:hypothetical protein
MKSQTIFQRTVAVLITLCCLVAQGTWAQGQFGDIPATVSASDVEATHVGYIQFMSHDSLVVNPATGLTDTLHIDDGHRFLTEEEFQALVATHPARAPRNINGVVVDTDQYGDWESQGDQLFGSCADLWSYKYPSVDANGNKVVLSALMGIPTKMTFFGGFGTAKPNNLVIGCHETITSNWECPTNYKKQGSALSGNGMLLEFCRYDFIRQPCCLVILPDYEGYGCTASRPHPYLYQELTARQVVDAVRYGIALHQEKGMASFESGWKSVSIGYSQGGSVALATHKFIETNGLSDELHFAGSVCGDGPYDPIAHLRYYMEDNGRSYDVGESGGERQTWHTRGTLSMPIVMPLILKGMCDSNPMMRQHKLNDYLTDCFLATSSTMMIEAKKNENKSDQYSTKDVNDVYRDCKNNGKSWTGKINNPYGDPITVGGTYSAGDMSNIFFWEFDETVWGDLRYIMTPECWDYFNNPSNFEDAQGNRITPTERGIMQDLHRALESNNLTVGWVPKNRVAFYHSTYDTVVPYANLLSFMKNQNTLKYYFYDGSIRCTHAGVNPQRTDSKEDANVFIYDTPKDNDHVAAGEDFFFWGASMKVAGITPDYWLFKWVVTGDN